MTRTVSRLWLLAWAGLLFAPAFGSGGQETGSPSASVSERENTAVVSRAPALPRTLQLHDHGTGSESALPSRISDDVPPSGAGYHAEVQRRAVPAVAVLSSHYPTGPPTSS